MKAVKGIAVCLCVGVIINAALAQTTKQCDSKVSAVTEIGSRTQLDETVSTVTPLRIENQKAKYLRIRLEIASQPNKPICSDWFITLRDSRYRVIQTLTAVDFATSASRWTNRIPGRTAIVDIQPCRIAGNTMPVVTVEEYVMVPTSIPNTYYSLQVPGTVNFTDLYGDDVDPIRRADGDFVAFIMSSWVRTTWTCSGVLVAPDILLTNWHCGGSPELPVESFWNENIVKSTIVDTSWDSDELSRDYIGVQLLEKNRDLDFALIRLQAINAAGLARFATLSMRPPVGGDPVFVIHHPAAAQKQMSQNCSIVDPTYRNWLISTSNTEFTHNCDTESGSSGAPVFNLRGEVIGIHHAGFSVYPDTCVEKDHVNKAVRMDKIIEFLRAQKPELLKQLSVQPVSTDAH